MIFNPSFDPFELKKEYELAKPFRHVVFDNFLVPDVAECVSKDFDYLVPDSRWYRYDNMFEKKYATDKWELMPSFIRTLLAILNTSMLINMLEVITGILGLTPDPYLRGGGIHLILTGGKLDIHSDFNWHKSLQLHRRLNLLVYFNRDYNNNFGGELELWNKDMTKCEKSIDPIYNRMVLFETTDWSNHGHPIPWSASPGMARKSLALYYYSATRPPYEISEPHSTLFKARPNDETNDEIEALRALRNKGRLNAGI